MKGYIFALSGSDPRDVMRSGVHGVWQPPRVARDGTARDWRAESWSSQMLATLSDYSTIRPGDRVFFFADRLVYGVGRVIDPSGTGRGAILNYPGSAHPAPDKPHPSNALYGPDESDEWRRIRVVVPFEADPAFFAEGLDMDEVLASPGADAAWGLRFWQGFSFKQLGEAETRLLIDVFERRFGNAPNGPADHTVGGTTDSWRLRFDIGIHRPIVVSELVAQDPHSYLRDGLFRNEEVLHALLIEALDMPVGPDSVLSNDHRLDVYHELAASPPKPPQWADRIDVMGTRGYPGKDRATASSIHFDVVEAKKDRVTGGGSIHDRVVSQLMKYVDFIAHNHAGGNYSAISAFYVAGGFSPEFVERHFEMQRGGQGVVTRSYVLNPREDPPTRTWGELRLLSYAWDSAARKIVLEAPA